MKQCCFQILALLLILALVFPTGVFAAEEGTAHIDSTPQGADIWVDGELYAPGVTPCDIPLSAGSHTLSVRMVGYDAYETTVRPGDGVTAKLSATIPDGPEVRTIVVNADDQGHADGRYITWENYERFVLNGEPEPEWKDEWDDADWTEEFLAYLDQVYNYPLWACNALRDGVSLREAICIAENDTGWYDEGQQIRWHYVIEFAEEKLGYEDGSDIDNNTYWMSTGINCYGRGSASYINGEPLFMKYSSEGLIPDPAKANWSTDGCFTVNGDRDRDGTPDVTLAGWEDYTWDGRWTLMLMCSDVHVVGLRFENTMHVSCGIPFHQPKNYFNIHDLYITGCEFESLDNGVGRFFGISGGGMYGQGAEDWGMPGAFDVDGYYFSGNTFLGAQLGIIVCGADCDYVSLKNLVIQGNHFINGSLFVRNADAHSWYMWGPYSEWGSEGGQGTTIGVSDYSTMEDVTISGNLMEFTAAAIGKTSFDGGYGEVLHLGNSNLGNSHHTMRNVTVRCNRSTLEQANADAFAHYPTAGISIGNVSVGESGSGYDPAAVAALCETSDNLFDGLLIAYNDFEVNHFDLSAIATVGNGQAGVDNHFRNIRIEHNRISSVKGLHFSGANGGSDLETVATGTLENLTIADNEITARKKTGWGPDSSSNNSGELDDFGVRLIGADVCNYDASNWDQPGEKKVWDKLELSVSGVRIEGNRIRGFANGVQVAGSHCERTHYVTGITVDQVTIKDNEIETDGVNKNCRNDGILLVGAIDGGTNCVVHDVTVSGNRVKAANGLMAAGFYLTGQSRFGTLDNQVLHMTADHNSFICTDPTGNGGFPVVTTDAMSAWGEIPYALGRTGVQALITGSNAEGYAWSGMELAALSRAATDETALLPAIQGCSDRAVGSRYIDWSKDNFAEPCETPLYMGVCDQPKYRPGSRHRYYVCSWAQAPTRENEVLPTCTQPGSCEETILCPFCRQVFGSGTKTELPALGHSWGRLSYDRSPDGGSVTASARCGRCGETLNETAPITAQITAAPTLEAEGERTFTAVFENPVFETQTWTESIPRLTPGDPCAQGHDWGEPVYTWAADNSSVTASRVCRHNPDHSETQTAPTTARVTRAATLEREGEMTYTASFSNPAFTVQTKTVSIPKLEPGQQPALPCTGGADCPGRVFTDMPAKGNWAHDPIDWAIVNQITAGTTKTTFSPGAGCTRAQVVTFLWRAAGEPEPKSTGTPFTDLKPDGYYGKAVAWAVENGITAGVTKDRFAPNNTCTRGQIVTFLYRYAGSPEPGQAAACFDQIIPRRGDGVGSQLDQQSCSNWEMKYTTAHRAVVQCSSAANTRDKLLTLGESAQAFPENDLVPRTANGRPYRTASAEPVFTDVPDHAFYAKAVAWAVENSVTAGVSKDKFAPNNTCTRAQVVTFLYRVAK